MSAQNGTSLLNYSIGYSNGNQFDIGEKVSLIIERETDLGFSVLINGSFKGLLYENEIFEPIEKNMEILGYIKKIREDGKYDVSLQPQGFLNVIESNCSLILNKLKIVKLIIVFSKFSVLF